MKIKCSECRKAFPWDIAKGWPKHCPECGVYCGTDGKDEVVMPFIRSAKTGANDKLYRDMERGSEVRAQAAADLLGVPASEVSDIKITNMKDNMREGDDAAITPANPVSQFMAANPGTTGFRGGQGVEYSGAVQSGPHPNAGAKTRTALHDFHAKLTQGAGVSERPANETMQPGYRRRG